MSMADPIETCRAIYAEARVFYAEVAPECGDLGFKILYGPPLVRPPILFIGYQPGGGPDDCARELASGAHVGWPPLLEYATESWRLAENLRGMFGVDLLKMSVGLNAIFFRAPSFGAYKKTTSLNARKKNEAFCLPRVEQIISAINPKCVVSIGFETLALFGTGAPDLKNEKGRILTKIGKIAMRPTIATLHLSGARISNTDRARIRDRVLSV